MHSQVIPFFYRALDLIKLTTEINYHAILILKHETWKKYRDIWSSPIYNIYGQ